MILSAIALLLCGVVVCCCSLQPPMTTGSHTHTRPHLSTPTTLRSPWGQLPPGMVQKDVFTSSEGGYHCFRMPALIYTCESSLLAFAEGRGQHTGSCSDQAGDVVIVMRRSSDGGMTWSPLSLVHSEYPKAAIGDPVPVEDSVTGKILLLFSRDKRQVPVMESSDEGSSWGNTVDITAMVALPSWSIVAPSVPGGLQLSSGRLIAGAYAMKESGLGSFAIYSDDHGNTWKRSEPAGDKSSDLCQITPLGYQEHREQLLMMTSKTPHGHFFVYSNDSGHTWSNLSMPSSLNPQTDCEGSVLSIPYEGVYMNTHLYTTQPHSVHHQNLTFFHSVDGGKVWKGDFLLWNGPSAYSSLTYDSDRFKVLCLFECGTNAYTEKLTLAIFSPLI